LKEVRYGMKSKILPIVPLALLALSIVASTGAAHAWYAEFQLEITDFIFVGVDEQGIHFDVPFEGVAGGPNIKEGTVEGVDHLLIDWENVAHVNVYFTITDKDGDKISASETGFSVVGRSPSQRTFEGMHATIIDEPDYPTTGKYTNLVGATFRGEGFISDFSRDPPGGHIHAKWYWP
jgi:hypothetical protein